MKSIKQKIALLAAASLGCLSLGFASAKAETATSIVSTTSCSQSSGESRPSFMVFS